MTIRNSYSKLIVKWPSLLLVLGFLVWLFLVLVNLFLISISLVTALAGLALSVYGTYVFGAALYLKFKGEHANRIRPPAWVTNETAIGLSSAVAVQTIRKAGIGMALGLIVTAFIADLSPMVFALSLGIGVVCVLVALRLINSQQWLHLSTSGMRGRNESGEEAWIPWSATVSITKSDQSTATWEMIVIESPQHGEILIPAALLKEASLRDAVQQWAPQEHPLAERISYQAPMC